MMPAFARVISDSRTASIASAQRERDQKVIADLENQQHAAQIKNQQTLGESEKSLALMGISSQTPTHVQP
jgi:hypothetical protein